MTINVRWLVAAIAMPALLMSSNGYADDDVVTAPSAAPTPAAEPAVGANKPSVIYRSWKKRPSFEQFQKTYPARAMRQNIQGRAEMTCIVGTDGSMTKCTVILETPEGYGFGAAALNLSKHFTMYTTMPDGVSTAGATVKIAIPFRLQ